MWDEREGEERDGGEVRETEGDGKGMKRILAHNRPKQIKSNCEYLLVSLVFISVKKIIIRIKNEQTKIPKGGNKINKSNNNSSLFNFFILLLKLQRKTLQ